MIPLLITQLRLRWGQAVVLLALSAAAVAVAASVPVYAEAVDRAAIARELSTSSGASRIVAAPVTDREWTVPPQQLDTQSRVLAQLPAFTPVVTVEFRVWGLRDEPPTVINDRMIGRDGFCAHAVFHSGRCPVGSREIALPLRLAELSDSVPGDEVTLTPIVLHPLMGPTPQGPPVVLTITGVFEATDPDSPYWATGQDPLGRGGQMPAIVTNRSVLQGMVHEVEVVYAEAVLADTTLTPQQIPELREQLAQAGAEGVEAGAGQLSPEFPRLLDRIEEQGSQARALLPITAAPLVALCWLVIYLAVGSGISARRHEIGVVALRGARPWRRGMVAATESLVPVLAGVPAGLGLAYLVVWLAAPGGVRVPWGAAGAAAATTAGLAAAGALVAVLVALRRELAAPVAQLLRRIPPRRAMAVAAVELLVVGVAVVIVADLRGFDRELVGLMVVAPAAVMLAAAVLVAQAVRPLVSLLGRWSLRRGWLGASLAALYLARRPGAARLLVALALVLGMLGFAVLSTEVAGKGRQAEVERALGADRVLTVRVPSDVSLLAAVHAADPTGQYAMAAVTTSGTRDEPPGIALDATRLAEVAVWSPGFGSGPEAVAELLRPPVPDPILVGDGELVAELSLDRFAVTETLTMAVRLEPQAGGDPVTVAFGPLVDARRSYRAAVSGCAQGCRLAGFVLTTTDAGDRYGLIGRTGLVLHALELDGTPVAPEQVPDATRWRAPDDPRTATTVLAQGVPGGLELTVLTPQRGEAYHLLPIDSAYPLPVVTSGGSPPGGMVTNVDRALVRVTELRQLPGLPGLPDGGIMMDLEYAQRATFGESDRARTAQVWLARHTPAGVVAQLEAAGLVIQDDRDLATLREALDSAGAAQALRFFHVAAAVAVLVGMLALGLVVGVDRSGWSQHLRQLRVQGLPERVLSRAARWAYGGTVLAAALAGALAVGTAWLVTNDRLPLGLDRASVPVWPQWAPVLIPWTVVVAVLLAAAAVAARWQRATVRGEVRR